MSIIISDLSLDLVNEKNPFRMDVKDADYPVAPLVYAENSVEKNTFRLNIVAYIPSDITSPPTFIMEESGEPVKISIEGGQEVLARSFIIEYDDTSSTMEQEYSLWNIVVEYQLVDTVSVDYILTRLRNIDPKTSRGTVTTVQHA